MPPDRAQRSCVLLAIARSAIARPIPPEAPGEWSREWLREPGATFVTLRLEGALRGCIGSVEPRRALGDDVGVNAHASAYRDPRFAPLTAFEMPRIEVEVSVLSAREAMRCASEAETLAALRPGVDGLYLEYGQMCATFLPQVWESLPEPADFLGELRRKAGLPASFWHGDVRLSRYTVDKYR